MTSFLTSQLSRRTLAAAIGPGAHPCLASESPMLPESMSIPQEAARIGVGIDTSRYGHYAAFLRDDLQPAAAELQFAESAKGYASLRQRLQEISQRSGPVQFVIRLDAAGQYADNLLRFLHGLFPAQPDGT